MSTDARANVFMAAVQKDIEQKDAAAAGKHAAAVQPHETKPQPDPSAHPTATRANQAPSQKGRIKFEGRKQINFGVDIDGANMLALARVTRGQRNSEIINEALRQYLEPEAGLLREQNKLFQV